MPPCEEAGVDVVVALATAALRDADNGSRLISRLEQILGSPITLLTGEEEARLCFLGQRAGVWVGHEPVLGLDLGGGSLEAGIGTIDEVIAVASVALGTARLRGELGTGELLTPDDRVAIAEVALPPGRAHPGHAGAGPPGRRNQGHRQRGDGAGPGPPGHGPAPAAARLGLGRPRVQVNQVEIPAGQLFELADRLATLDLDARLALPGIQTRRAPLLPIGAVVLSTLVESLGLQRLVVSEWGLREGAVIGALRPASREPPARVSRRREAVECAPEPQAFLPRIRFMPVPQVGHLPLADRRPLAISTSSPSNCRFSRHFTQYPSYDAMSPPRDSDGGHPVIGWTERIGPGRWKGGWDASNCLQ